MTYDGCLTESKIFEQSLVDSITHNNASPIILNINNDTYILVTCGLNKLNRMFIIQ